MLLSSSAARFAVTTRGSQSVGQHPPSGTRVVAQSLSVEQAESSAGAGAVASGPRTGREGAARAAGAGRSAGEETQARASRQAAGVRMR